MTQKNKKQFGVWLDTHQATVIGRANADAEDFTVLAVAGNAGAEHNTSEKNQNNDERTLVTNCDHLKTLKFSPVLPFAFTEHGAVMLASILNSERAIEMNIQIVRVFTKIREMLLAHKDILLQLEKIEKKLTGHDEDISLIFQYLKQLLNPPSPPRQKIGFRRKDEQS